MQEHLTPPLNSRRNPKWRRRRCGLSTKTGTILFKTE